MSWQTLYEEKRLEADQAVDQLTESKRQLLRTNEELMSQLRTHGTDKANLESTFLQLTT